MGMLTSADLASLRAQAAAACDTACTIKQVTTSKGTYGETIETEGADIDTVALLEKPSGGLLATYADLIAAQKTWLTHFPWGTDVEENSNLYIGSKKLKVQALLDLSSYPVFTDCLVTEVG